MFCDRMDVEKSQRVPPFSFFWHCEIFSRKWKFLFSSIFSCFATEWMLKNLKGSTLPVFWHCETLARQGLALASPGAPLGPFVWVCNCFEKFFFQKFSIFEYCKRVLDTWKSFCYIWALDMAPTWAGPGLFLVLLAGSQNCEPADTRIAPLLGLFGWAHKTKVSNLCWVSWWPSSVVSFRLYHSVDQSTVVTPAENISGNFSSVFGRLVGNWQFAQISAFIYNYAKSKSFTWDGCFRLDDRIIDNIFGFWLSSVFEEKFDIFGLKHG